MMAAKGLINEDLAQGAYADIVKSDKQADIRLKALKMIKDKGFKQKMYVDFAMWSEPEVINKITDVSMLKNIWEQWKEPSKWKHHGGYSGQHFVNALAKRLENGRKK
ncbi:hypothetical protein LJC56_08595 [Christensenellaceae bacterium OttesenSCG-928-K19]|nr:hypothetical protein [Christensenellaceae bacterium OttesenSCG-928-K19]